MHTLRGCRSSPTSYYIFADQSSVGVGNVLGYIFGYLDLPRHFHVLGDTQFKILVSIASIALSSLVLISVLTVKERNPQLDPPTKDEQEGLGFLSFFKQVFTSILRLPPQIRQVCEIQFFHWMGWFPFLFYITTYIGQLFVDKTLSPDMTEDQVEALWARATRIGTLALLIYAITSFGANIILPFLIVPSYEHDTVRTEDIVRPYTPTSPIGTRHGNASYNDLARSRTDSISSSYFAHTDSFGGDKSKVAPTFLNKFLGGVQIPGLTLRRTWLLAQLLYVACMFSTFFITTSTGATVMTAFCGLSWALTLWYVSSNSFQVTRSVLSHVSIQSNQSLLPNLYRSSF